MLVTIIIPSFEQGAFIEECICSILKQNYINLEIFVYDSCSSDNTKELLDQYKSRLNIFIEKDLSQAHAINKGLIRCRGDIIGFLNSDDVLLPNTLEKIVKYWKANPSIDLLYGKGKYIDSHGSELGYYPTKEWNFHDFQGECFICQPSCFWSRRIMNRIGILDQRLNCCLDYDYWLRVAKANGAIYYLEDFLACSRDYPETKTRSLRKEIFNEIFSLSLKRLGYINKSWIKQWLNYLKYEDKSFLSRMLPSSEKSLDVVAKAGEVISYTLSKDTYFVDPVSSKVV